MCNAADQDERRRRTSSAQKPLNIQTLSFLDAINHFSGGLDYESVYMKAKSDYVLSPLSPSAIAAMLAAVAQVPVGGIAVLCDAYGGAVAAPAGGDTAV